MIDKEHKRLTVMALRSAFLKSKTRYSAYKKARIERGKYKCNHCGGIFKQKELQVDHIDNMMKDDIWENILTRFWSEDNLQCLCKDCHKEKTRKERSNGRK